MTIAPRELLAVDTDVLVLGGGLAGHRAAVAAREEGVRVGHAYLAHGASPFVIAANVPLGHANPSDSPEVYFTDMVEGGYYLNDRRLVRRLADAAIPSLQDLEHLAIPFARDGDRYRQRHLSGNRYPRSVYVPEGTGRVILDRLRERCRALGVETWSGWQVLALLRDGPQIVGCLMKKRRGEGLLAVRARAVILAMGGIGRLYDDSTYPADIAADAYALAFSAGARLIDMEFVQFEPVVTVAPEGCRGMEMPTAMLGDGAHLLNTHGERFMLRHNPQHGETQVEKARLALLIQREIDEGRGLPGDTVLFDTTVVPRDQLESYVAHCRRLRAAGLEPTEQGPHVRPAAHSEMGGVFIDADGWSGVPGLYACGEASGGVHGASRLAGNGGGEVLAMGWVVGRAAAKGLDDGPPRDWARIQSEAMGCLLAELAGTPRLASDEMAAAVRHVMGRAAGLYRTGDELEEARRELIRLQRDADAGLRADDLETVAKALTARSMLLTARMIVEAALARTESRGAHQRRDFPKRDDARWLVHLACCKGNGGDLVLEPLPIH